MAIQGFCSDAFLPFKSAYQQNFLDGLEIGSSLAAYQGGDLVMSLWGGRRDDLRVEPFEEHSLVQTFSVGKIAAAMALLKTVDLGLVALDEPVARYWPEFGQHGKDAITVREALTQRALVPGFVEPLPAEARLDWARWTAAIAAEKPWFERGTACYHPLNFGVILCEIVRRVTGEPFEAWFRREIAEPAGIDFHFSIPDAASQARYCEPHPTRFLPYEEDSLEYRVFTSFEGEPTPEQQMTMLSPGSSGFATARGLAALGSVLARHGLGAHGRVLSEHIAGEALSEQYHGYCHCVGDMRYGLGIGLASPHLMGFKYPGPHTAMWGGYGGHFLFLDPTTEICVAYVTNLLLLDDFDGADWGGPLSLRQNRLFDAYEGVVALLDA